VIVLACMMHWTESMMFVVPVAAVGGWSWWSARRTSRRGDERDPGAPVG
jgi:hypothetical protein